MNGDSTENSDRHVFAFFQFNAHQGLRMGLAGSIMETAHQQADPLSCHRRRGLGRGKPALIDDRDAARNFKHFIKVLTDDNHGGTTLGEVDQSLANAARGTCVNAPGRLIDHQHYRLPVEFASNDEFLQIAA
jgi:hypothetical protein